MNTVQSSRNSKNVRMLGVQPICASVLLTCKSLSGGQGYFHREDAKSAKKRDFKNFAFFAVDFWGCGWAALCSSVVSKLCWFEIQFFTGQLREPLCPPCLRGELVY